MSATVVGAHEYAGPPEPGLPSRLGGLWRGPSRDPAWARPALLVAKHEIHYYVGQGSNSFGGGSVSSSIASCVSAHYKAETVGGTTVYDLTKPAS